MKDKVINPDLLADEIRRRESANRRRRPLWGLMSFLAHLVMIVAIVFLTPVKKLIIEEEQKRNPAEDLSADRIEQIDDRLQLARVNELLAQLQAMQAVLHNMDVLKRELQKDYDSYAEKKSVDIKEEVAKIIEEAEAFQKNALAAQDPIITAVASMVEEEKKDLTDEERSKKLRNDAENLKTEKSLKVVTAQADAANAFDRIQVQSEFGGYKKTAAAAEKIRDSQIEASSLQAQAQDEAYEIASKLSEYKWVLKRVDEEKNALEREVKNLEKSRQDQSTAKENKAQFEKVVAESSSEAEKAKQQIASLKEQKAKIVGDAKPEKKERERLSQEISRVERSLRHFERDAKDHDWKIKREERHLENAVRTEKEMEKRIAARKEKIKEVQKRADDIREIQKRNVNELQVKKLERAKATQSDIANHIEILKKILKDDTPEQTKLVPPQHVENDLVTKSTVSMELVEAFEFAKKIEEEIVESYKDIKATETAISRKMSFEAAHKITDVAKAVRIEANKEILEKKSRTKEALDKKKAAQTEVIRETDAMVETALAMMKEAMEIVKPDSEDKAMASDTSSNVIKWLSEKDFEKRESAEEVAKRLEEMEKLSEYQLALTQAAAESDSERAKDLTKVSASASEVAKNINEANKSSAESEKGSTLRMSASTPPPIDGKMPGLVAGNVINFSQSEVSGIPAQWAYINSWYVIGPFPNPNRVNLRRKFPPESVIDLDATYIGKDGRTVSWQYAQARSSEPKEWWRSERKCEITPPGSGEYEIWYAYAELISDIDCDRWVAVGSDDRSDMWVNEIPIWGSSNQLKSWRVDEGYRRIHLNKGKNKILVRIENGWHSFGWSVCVSLTDEIVK